MTPVHILLVLAGVDFTDASKKKFVESRIRNGTNQHRPETKAKMSALGSGENNPFYGKHHTAETKRKIVEGRMRNGTLGYFPEKTFTLLRIAKELHDAGVDTGKITSLAMKQMKENGMKIRKVHAYRVLPQEYKNPYRVVINRNNRIRKCPAKGLRHNLPPCLSILDDIGLNLQPYSESS